MPFEQKSNSGALFKNDKKGNDRAPDYKGDAMIDGKKFFISAWIKEPKSSGGQKFMSLSFEEPRKSEGKTETRKPAPIDDDLPPF